MKVRQLLLAAILSLGVSVARAEIVDVSDNHGGLLSAYQTQWALFAARRVNVRIVGPCVSACTVLIGYIPSPAYLRSAGRLPRIPIGPPPGSPRRSCGAPIHPTSACGSASMAG